MNTLLFLSWALVAADPAAPLAVAQPLIDCGDVRAGLPLVQKFRLTNRARDVLKITDLVALNCGCVRATMTARALLPAENAEVTVEVNTLGQPAGANSWKVAVRYRVDATDGRPPASGEEILELKAQVVREVTVEPVAVSLILDGPAKHTIKVADHRARPLSVRSVQTSSPHLKAVSQRGAPVPDSPRAYAIALEVLESLPVGRHTELVTIDTDDPEYKSFQVPVQITKRPANQVAALPEQVSLRLATGQTAASALVRLRDGSGQRVAIEKAEADHAAVRLKWASGPDAMATLRVTVEPGLSKAGPATVKVYLSEPPGQVISIPVSWQGP